MRKKGFSLIELLVVLVIAGVLVTALYTTYISLYSGSKQLSKVAESNIENIISSEIIRVDLSNAGFGLARGEETAAGDTLYPVGWDDGTLQIFTTYDRLEPRTHGWVLLKCEEEGVSCETDNDSDRREAVHFNGLKVIDTGTNRIIEHDLNSVTTLDFRYAVGYPYDTGAAEKFREINYRIADDCDDDGNADISDRCSPNTSVLCRGTVPVADCVGGWAVYAGYDDGGEIVYDTLANVITDDPDNLFNLRRLVLYVLVQEGQFDRNFNFGADEMVKELDFDAEDNALDQLSMPLPDESRNYRWNIMTIDTKTYNIGDKYDNE
ncbi:prepilin-type N-terminal cleavage/methylation domain-containing protein [Geovibrio thiophilus]|uniref:Prepilin-type N-terminal cleavage/methylation domain-containing protein n=1 Tax=Geovibrio thiophilus TaxID=139438 RepID=A0A410JVM1_9BACT|nr:prepilin-type N-terminal cleavage/methylation domain-containing protein [Geovibrio thiophilus]QAR32071.1 prepilin-type N-terminal cleavage/methylation domain-containing protein [Geovibrio thiophilus]